MKQSNVVSLVVLLRACSNPCGLPMETSCRNAYFHDHTRYVENNTVDDSGSDRELLGEIF